MSEADERGRPVLDPVDEARRERRDEIGLGLLFVFLGSVLAASPWLVPGAARGFDVGVGLALVFGGGLALIGAVRMFRALGAGDAVVAAEPAQLAAQGDADAPERHVA